MQIFKPNKYGYYLTDELTISIQEAENYFNSDQWDAPTSHTGGWAELKEKIKTVVNNAKMRAAKAAGLSDGITIKSIINKLLGLFNKCVSFIRDKVKEYGPKIKEYGDKLCNYIMDAIDYIKTEFN